MAEQETKKPRKNKTMGFEAKPLSETRITAEIIKAPNGNDCLVVRCPLSKPEPSESGKTMCVASTRGNRTTSLKVNGKVVLLGLNAYYKP